MFVMVCMSMRECVRITCVGVHCMCVCECVYSVSVCVRSVVHACVSGNYGNECVVCVSV